MIMGLGMAHVYAAPSLQMHVFDQVDEQSAIHPSIQTRGHVVLSPARKHRLQTHVFETPKHSGMGSPAAKQINNTPRLEYQHAEFYVSTGYRQDNLKWSIAGSNGFPNILSELTWKDIDIATINMGTTLYLQSNWLLNIDASYGHIFDGRNQDSDYFGNNKTLEFSRSNNDSDKGMTLDANINTGYKFLALKENQHEVYLIPKIGFSYHAQFLNMTNGFQTIPTLGSFQGLDSHYDSSWMGPWLGLESQIIFNNKFTFSTNVEYHYAFYDATANWNLRPDFAHPESFTHEAEGYGFVGNIEGQIRLRDDVSLKVSLNYQEWQADRNGIDKTFFADGSSLTTGFNGVNWRSFAANVGLEYDF